MKQVISTLFTFCAVLFIVVAPALADPPANLHNAVLLALDQVPADPPITWDSLERVASNPDVMLYLEKYPICIKIGECDLLFKRWDSTSRILLRVGGNVIDVRVMHLSYPEEDNNQREMALGFLSRHRESDLWVALISALQTR